MSERINRRAFLAAGALSAASPLLYSCGSGRMAQIEPTENKPIRLNTARVSIARCGDYGPGIRSAMEECFDGLGGIGTLVKNKTVTIKVNLTGEDFPVMFGLPCGETYVTHENSVKALTAILFDNGARRVRIVESAPARETLEVFASRRAGWDVNSILSLGEVEFENTRNLGKGKKYATLKPKSGGYMFDHFMLNHSYEDTDVFISLAKMKNHATAGVTLSMKNLFGITPNSIYGDDPGENAEKGRGKQLHYSRGFSAEGEKEGFSDQNDHFRVPYIVTDINDARPIDLAIVDGISTISGGEGPWNRRGGNLRLEKAGVIIAGLNPVSTDAAATAVMGYSNPLANHRSSAPFNRCINHILAAHQAGVGTGDLSQVEISGLSIEEAKHPFPGAA